MPLNAAVEGDKTAGVVQVHSKWELVDYDADSDEEDITGTGYVTRTCTHAQTDTYKGFC